MRTALAIVTLFLITIGAPQRAAAEGRIGMDGHGGWNGYSMQSFNETVSSFNRDFSTTLPPIHDGGSWGVGLRMWPHPDWRIRLGFEDLDARSEGSGVKFDLGVRAYTLGVTWFAPTNHPLRFGIGAALGPHSAHGGLDVPGATLESSGDGFGGQVAGEAMVPLAGGWSVNGAMGYRWMTIDQLKLNGSSDGLEAQYDGWLLQIGIAVDERP
jgi:hypothetical protein